MSNSSQSHDEPEYTSRKYHYADKAVAVYAKTQIDAIIRGFL